MSTLNIELEEIEIKMEKLNSLLLMLEQSFILDGFGGKIFLPGVSLMSDLSEEITNQTKELRKKLDSEVYHG